ncbi:MAG: hypothetical protein ABIF01_04420 [Candidatus Micrarchaeota archaeon]
MQKTQVKQENRGPITAIKVLTTAMIVPIAVAGILTVNHEFFSGKQGKPPLMQNQLTNESTSISASMPGEKERPKEEKRTPRPIPAAILPEEDIKRVRKALELEGNGNGKPNEKGGGSAGPENMGRSQALRTGHNPKGSA